MSDTKNTPTAASLQSKLSQYGADASHIVIEDGSLILLPPGISLKNITDFLNKALNEFGDFGKIIPDDLPIDGVRLYSMQFRPAKGEEPYLLDFSLSWESAKWEMIPGVIALESPSMSIQVLGGQLSGSVSGIIEIEKIPLLIEVEMPNRTFSVELAQDGKTHSPKELFQKFQSSPGGDAGSGQKGKGVDLGVLTLDDLSLLGNFNQQKRALFHIALGKIKLGHGDLALQLSLDYTGGNPSSVKGMVWGDYIVPEKDPILELTLMAEYDGPGQGWQFKGSMEGKASKDKDGKEIFGPSLNAMIAALEGKTEAEVSGLPKILDEIGIKFLNLSYNTSTGDFEASCEVDTSGLFAKGADVDFIVHVSLRRQGDPASGTTSYDKSFSGSLIFKLESGLQMEFDAVFDQTTQATSFIADYQNLGGGKIRIGDLTKLLNPNFDIPFTIQLKDAFFAYVDLKEAEAGEATGSRFLLGLDIDGGINLSNLPLVGKMFPPSETLKIGVQPIVASGPTTAENPIIFTTAQLSEIASKTPGGAITLPNKDLKANINFVVNLQLGEKTYALDIPIQLSKKLKETKPGQKASEGKAATPVNKEIEPAPEGTKTGTSPGAIATTPAGAGSDSAGGIQWFNLQKSFGPVSFNRVGVQYADGKIWAYLDASLGMAGLTLSLSGLGVGTPIGEFHPTFTLQGLGLDFKEGPIEIGGYFLRTHITTDSEGKALAQKDQYWEYDGLATIKAEILNVSAIGSYAKVDGHTSLFLYAVLNYPIGGPPFFFLTGLAAGFGYNRAVRMPAISEVGTFPLVNEAISGEGSTPPSDPLARRNYLQEEISKLHSWIYPKPGEYFLAAGIRFSTFELVDSFAMVSVSFGQEFELDILGISTLIVPTPEEGNAVDPLAELQMALKATFAPAEGYLGIQAQITSNSFILSRSCKLTGGFAFFVWFGGDHAGDFVISLGGYNSRFFKPPWYPTVPRLGFNWVLIPPLTLKGEIYFALCSHALMAGGSLAALFHLGPIRAWFIIGADFIISWKPYFYDARIYLDMGVSVTFWLFGTHTITIHLGANLHIWGPDFSGSVTIHLWIISFTISFGDASPKPQPLSWSTFQSSFLPKPEKVLSLAVSNGLIKESKKKDKSLWVINPKDFTVNVNTTVPFVQTAIANGATLKLDSLNETVKQGVPTIQAFDYKGVQAPGHSTITPDAHGIAPMALKASNITKSLVTITVSKKEQDDKWVPIPENFSFRPILKRMPTAMWGQEIETTVSGKRYIENALTGFEILPATPPKPGETQAIPKKDLQYTTSHIDKAFKFESIQSAVADTSKGTGKAAIKATIADPGVMAVRKSMLEGLGLDYDRLGISTPAGIAEDFVRNPQICTLQ